MKSDRAEKMRVNDQITAARVLLIDDEGQRVGEVSRDEAMSRARDAGLDLVEVAPSADPPVCRLTNVGKARYQAEQRQRASRRASVQTDIKEIRLRPSIGEHDYQVKLKKLRELLARGLRVRVSVTLKGRLQSRPEAATELLERVRDDISDIASCDAFTSLGRNHSLMAAKTTTSRRRADSAP